MTTGNGAATTAKATTTAKRAKDQPIEIPRLQLLEALVPVRGTSRLIVHRFSEKAKKEMLKKQMKVAKQGKEAKDPVENFLSTFYVDRGDLGERPTSYEDGQFTRARPGGDPFVFPSLAFKAAMVGACRHVDGMTMTTTKGAFHVLGEFVELEYDEDPYMREDVVRVGPSKVADLRYRGVFENWGAILRVQFNSRSCSLEQLVNLINIAGFSSGIGEWRPEKDGNSGMFSLDVDREVIVNEK